VELEPLAVVIMLVAVTGVTVAASTAAAGQQSESALEGVLDGPAENESTAAWTMTGVRTTLSFAEGQRLRLQSGLTSLPAPALEALGLESDEPTASEKASAVASVWAEHNETLESYASSRQNWTDDRTVEITWIVDDETATQYLLANATDGSVSTRMVNETSRTPTDDVVLCGDAAENSPDELETFVSKFAQPNEDVTKPYLAKLRGRYGGDVETSLLPSSGSCSVSNTTESLEVAYAG
jgi:hypothetical protein